MSTMYMTFAVVAFALAFTIRYWINRRRFNRRTMTGSEVFSSYESAWMTRLGERFLWLVSFALILVACFFLLGYCTQQRHEKKATKTHADQRLVK